MPDLTVQVRDRDIIVSKPSDGLSITYRKDGFAPMLVAIDDIRDRPTPEELASSHARGERPLRKQSHSAG